MIESMLVLVILTFQLSMGYVLNSSSELHYEAKLGRDFNYSSHLEQGGERTKIVDDMILPVEFGQPNWGPRWGMRDKRVRWPNATVVYEITPEFNDLEKEKIIKGMAKISSVTCVSFREKRKEDKDYTRITKTGPTLTGCSSDVGRIGGRQRLVLGAPGCIQSGIVAHELMHTLGFFHEHQRPDRDEYIVINWSNIQDVAVESFDKYNSKLVDTFSAPYDYNSITHYGKFGFAVNQSTPTIYRQGCPSCPLGQTDQLTPFDAHKIRHMYNCSEDFL